MFEKNVELAGKLKISKWRRLAFGSWSKPTDPSIYGVLELNVEKVLECLQETKKNPQLPNVTLTHFSAKAIAEAMKESPELNSVLRMGRLYERKYIDLCFQIADDKDGKNLSSATLRDASTKSVYDIATFLQKKAKSVREEGDPDFKNIKKIGLGIPGFMMGVAIECLGFLMYTLNIWSPLYGLKKDAFGSVLITSIGPLGLDFAFPALFYRGSRVPVIVALGEVREAPFIEDGQIKIKPMMKICATFDHRYIDGAKAGRLVNIIRECFKDPAPFFKDYVQKL